jgi:hypothetical protein
MNTLHDTCLVEREPLCETCWHLVERESDPDGFESPRTQKASPYGATPIPCVLDYRTDAFWEIPKSPVPVDRSPFFGGGSHTGYRTGPGFQGGGHTGDRTGPGFWRDQTGFWDRLMSCCFKLRKKLFPLRGMARERVEKRSSNFRVKKTRSKCKCGYTSTHPQNE